MQPEAISISDTVTPSTDDRIDVICDAFEERLIRGERPEISEFASQAGPELHSDLFAELLLVEIEYRSGRGEAVSKVEYLERFPEFADAIETVGHDLSWTTSDKVGDPPSVVNGKIFLERFVLSDRIGSGASGEVWKARDPRLGRNVAIKIPNSPHLSAEERRRFLREGRAAAQLRHPNIVTVHEASREGGAAFIVADYIDGRDLRRHLAETKPTYREADQLCEKIADALHYAHETGVVHRDLKPANIILDSAGEPHITDFGLAKWAGDAREMTISGQMLGTPAYMSPEQARGESAAVDRRADVFALGVMLYEMLAGRCPFTGGQAAVLTSIINSPAVRPSAHDKRIPRDLETICLKAIEKQPERRYATAAEFAADLRRYLAGDPIRARRAKPRELAWRWARRRPALVAAIVLGATAAFAVGMNKRLSQKNYELLGVKPVALTTEPPGAYTVFVPISDADGRPDPNSDAVVRGVTPIECDLKPGNYLVVAALPNGRFHEVIRHVPRDPESIAGAGNHQFWRVRDDGVVKLPTINIPPRTVTDGMTLVSPSATHSPPDDRIDSELEVGSLYMDAKEFTWGERRRWMRIGVNVVQGPQSEWVPATYDEAMRWAENRGKRLMTKEEYEYAAAALAQARRETAADGGPASKYSPVDLTPQVPEWTSSQVISHQSTQRPHRFEEPFSTNSYRLVCGTPIPGTTPIVTGEPGNEVTVFGMSRGMSKGIGFRGVRSERPRYLDKSAPE